MGDIFQDLRYAVRMLLKSPGFTAVALITLALGIGANTAMFSIVDAVLLRPLPFAQPGELVRLYETEAQAGRYPFAGPDFLDWKAQNHTFQDMTLTAWVPPMNLSGQGEPVNAIATPTEANFFSLLGARALLGRTFAADEDHRGHERVAILSYSLWQSHFGRDRSVIGRTVELDGQAYTVIGVMPPSFRYPLATQLWIPLVMDLQSLYPRGTHAYSAIGRLKPGVTLDKALADLSLIAANLEKQYPNSNYKVGATLVTLQEAMVGQSRKSLLLMFWAVALVLLIACANLANLLLSRAVGRRREIAVRQALGAQRGRLIRQLLTESVLLSVVGGAAGLLVAGPCLTLIGTTKSFGIPTYNTIEVNPAVLAITFGMAVVTGILFGLIPALHISRSGSFGEFKGAGSAAGYGRRRRLAADTLVVTEVALSLLLLIGAGLLLTAFVRLRNQNIGVRPQGVLTATISLPGKKYGEDPAAFQFSQALLDRIKALPGVDAAALSDRLPLEGGNNSYAHVRGRPFQPMSGPLVDTHAVTPDYFKVMGIPVLQGRALSAEDVATERSLDNRIRQASKAKQELPPEVTDTMAYPTVINEAAAQALWPNQNPLGQMFSFGGEHGPWRQVVGVVRDNKQWSLTHAPVPEEFSSYTGDSFVIVTLHTSLPPATVVPAIRKAVGQLDPTLSLYSVRTMDEIIAEAAGAQQFVAGLVGSFAALALLLAAIGIYGVLSYAVRQRTREIGVRVALGARPADILRLVIGSGLRLAVIGVGAGVLAALLLTRFLRSLLFGIGATHPPAFLAAAVLFSFVALLASYLPARRATKVDPMVALRYE